MSAVNATTSGVQALNSQDAAKLAEQRVHEPSMEEILASIRRIIADDQVLPLSSRSPATTAADAESAASVQPGRVAPEPPVRPAVRVVPASLPPQAAPAASDADDLAGLSEELGVQAIKPAPALVVAASAPATEVAAPKQPVERRLRREAPPPPIRPAAPPAPSPDPARAPLGGQAENGHREPGAVSVREADLDPLMSAQTSASVASAFNTLAATTLVQNLPSIEEMARDMLRPLLKSWLDDNLPVIVERLVRAEIERVARGGR